MKCFLKKTYGETIIRKCFDGKFFSFRLSLIFILLQETKNSTLFNENCTQENVKCHIQHEESLLR